MLDKSYNPDDIEKKYYSFWENNGFFDAGKDLQKAKNPEQNFCIMLPPPNVTGTLHMGHGFNQTLMDSLIRYHRMKGDNTLWQPGTDHAGIATQIVVERQLDAQKISRHDLGREKFVEKVWKWKKLSGGTITQQMRRLGTSPDWKRERFTMDEGLSKAVVETFVRLYNDGLIYRGKKLVNWDPKLQTAVSDLEVVQNEENGNLWHIRYDLADNSGDFLIVATTRPETLFGDTAVMVHPDDERYQKYIGKQIKLPLTNRTIPIIADAYVDKEFGTGCVKVTPAHDFNDYEVGKRHNLPLISVLTLEAKMSAEPEACVPENLHGLDRLVARKKVVQELQNLGLLVKIEEHKHKIPRGDRTDEIIEPMLTNQWFVAMSKPTAKNGISITQRALDAVKNGEVKFFPENWVNIYNQWLNNIQDWCISRQLWWGHQIPAWYGEGDILVVAHNENEAKQIAAEKFNYYGELVRDNDVLDTWFSSALWTFSTLDWTGDENLDLQNPMLQQYLPSSVLMTGFDIIFFWVARMIIMTLYLTDKVPFKHVYVHGLIRDQDGQKMSKSKGNVIDPIDIIDGIGLEKLLEKRTFGLMNPKQKDAIIKKTKKDFPNGFTAIGTDALRFTFLSLASPGRDIKYDFARGEGYRSFCNKLWNATRFVLMNISDEDKQKLNNFHENNPKIFEQISWKEHWILSALQNTIAEIHKNFANYRFDYIAKTFYEFVWNEFCDWYVEIAKTTLSQPSEKINESEKLKVRFVLVYVLENILRLAHPLIPFISEELWQNVAEIINAKKTPSIMLAKFPDFDATLVDSNAEQQISNLKTLVSASRNLRTEMQISPSVKTPLVIEIAKNNSQKLVEIQEFMPYLKSLSKLSDVQIVDNLESSQDDALAPISVVDGGLRLMLKVEIDVAAEKSRLQKEIAALQKQISICQNKLNNKNFVDKAPAAVVEQENQRLKNFVENQTKLQQQLNKLN